MGIVKISPYKNVKIKFQTCGTYAVEFQHIDFFINTDFVITNMFL